MSDTIKDVATKKQELVQSVLMSGAWLSSWLSASAQGHRLFEKQVEQAEQSGRDRHPARRFQDLAAAMKLVVIEFSHRSAFHFFNDSVPELVRRSNSIGATVLAFSRSVHNVPLPA